MRSSTSVASTQLVINPIPWSSPQSLASLAPRFPTELSSHISLCILVGENGSQFRSQDFYSTLHNVRPPRTMTLKRAPPSHARWRLARRVIAITRYSGYQKTAFVLDGIVHDIYLMSQNMLLCSRWTFWFQIRNTSKKSALEVSRGEHHCFRSGTCWCGFPLPFLDIYFQY